MDEGDFFVLGVFHLGGYRVEVGMQMSGKRKGRYGGECLAGCFCSQRDAGIASNLAGGKGQGS